METIYGFYVAAWLIMQGQAAIPFATMDACVATQNTETLSRIASVCAPTGDPMDRYREVFRLMYDIERGSTSEPGVDDLGHIQDAAQQGREDADAAQQDEEND